MGVIIKTIKDGKMKKDLHKIVDLNHYNAFNSAKRITLKAIDDIIKNGNQEGCIEVSTETKDQTYKIHVVKVETGRGIEPFVVFTSYYNGDETYSETMKGIEYQKVEKLMDERDREEEKERFLLELEKFRDVAFEYGERRCS